MFSIASPTLSRAAIYLCIARTRKAGYTSHRASLSARRSRQASCTQPKLHCLIGVYVRQNEPCRATTGITITVYLAVSGSTISTIYEYTEQREVLLQQSKRSSHWSKVLQEARQEARLRQPCQTRSRRDGKSRPGRAASHRPRAPGPLRTVTSIFSRTRSRTPERHLVRVRAIYARALASGTGLFAAAFAFFARAEVAASTDLWRRRRGVFN